MKAAIVILAVVVVLLGLAVGVETVMLAGISFGTLPEMRRQLDELKLASAGLTSERQPLLEAAIDVPQSVRVGEDIRVIVRMTNSHAEPVTLDSVDVDNGLLRGFQVIRVEPRPEATFSLPPELDQRSWAFHTPVAAGGQMTVTFHLRPLAAGHYSGNIDVCNPNQDYVGMFADIVVGQ
ncbi:MAG: hypothetical protein GXY74_15365 [Phycisphaerae bacterium]|nr:hypothetical protein [Phycisphaerae bacterium]